MNKNDESHNILAKELKLKPKTKAFADKLLSDPKISQTQAYIETHPTNNRNTAKANASELLAKANVQVYMKKHVGKAKSRIVELVDSDKQEIALKASQDILDRTEGKPIQRQVTQSTNLNVNADISPELAEDFTRFLLGKTKQ